MNAIDSAFGHANLRSLIVSDTSLRFAKRPHVFGSQLYRVTSRNVETDIERLHLACMREDIDDPYISYEGLQS